MSSRFNSLGLRTFYEKNTIFSQNNYVIKIIRWNFCCSEFSWFSEQQGLIFFTKLFGLLPSVFLIGIVWCIYICIYVNYNIDRSAYSVYHKFQEYFILVLIFELQYFSFKPMADRTLLFRDSQVTYLYRLIVQVLSKYLHCVIHSLLCKTHNCNYYFLSFVEITQKY